MGELVLPRLVEGPAEGAQNLTVSALVCYEECSLRYFYQYVEKTAPEPTYAMRRGTSVHRLIEKLLLSQEVTAEELGGLDGYGKECWENFRRSRFAERFPLHVEKRFCLQLGTEVYCRGRVDVVLPGPLGPEVVDFKTGRVPQREDLAANLQLPLYAVAVHRLVPSEKEPNETDYTWFYLKEGVELGFPLTAKVERAIHARALKLALMIRDELWYDHPCLTCWGCKRVGESLLEGKPPNHEVSQPV